MTRLSAYNKLMKHFEVQPYSGDLFCVRIQHVPTGTVLWKGTQKDCLIHRRNTVTAILDILVPEQGQAAADGVV